MNLPVPYDPEFAAWQQPLIVFTPPHPTGWSFDFVEERATEWPFSINFSEFADGRSMWFDKQGQPITVERWGELREIGVDPDGRYGPNSYLRIGEDTVIVGHFPEPPDEVWVSTVWLGMDHGFGFGRGDDEYRPVIFESMIFGGKYDQACMRYCTEEEAIKGHAEAVVDLRAGMPPWWAYGGQEHDEWHSKPLGNGEP